MRQLKYSEYKGARKLLFFDLIGHPAIEVLRGIIEQVAPGARVEELGYDELHDKYLYAIIIYTDENYACEDRIVLYELAHPS